ncbi:alpha-l-arabinofuranosidase 2 [Nicotiana attenuata]|uniref:non-reducing end alpha-L-arabinofuranosidase n=1 Tax=Nicotiana attenuata TaxID=49451 RepID=A0A1J6J2W3_NICAT|nr:alpha-l-arabinofuranosidase 2 [Nicotiana attenuata]
MSPNGLLQGSYSLFFYPKVVSFGTSTRRRLFCRRRLVKKCITIGAWEERPEHLGDVWNYWTDDGLGHFEFLQLAEGLDALPIWVFNNGISHNDQVDTFHVLPLVQIYDNASTVFSLANHFDGAPRNGPKAFISEYAMMLEKVVNFGSSTVALKISISGLEQNSLQSFGATKTTLTSTNVMDENSFEDPKKVSPVEILVKQVSENMDVVLSPYSFTSFDLLRKSIGIRTTTTASDLESSF